MKILQINTWYNVGSTGKLVFDLHKAYLANGFDSYVLYGRGKKETEDSKHIFKIANSFESKTNSVLSRLSGVMYGGCYFATKKAFALIKKINPDVIHIHCTNSFIINNYKLFNFIGKNNFKVIITLHAEYLYTGSCSHTFNCEQWKTGCKKCPNLKFATRSLLFDRTRKSWAMMHSALGQIDVDNRKIVSVSEWLKNKASESSTFKNDKIEVIHNGIDTSIFKYCPLEKNKFAYLKEKYKTIYLFVTPSLNTNNGNLKGGDYFVEITKIFKDNKDVGFILACPLKDKNAIEKNDNIIFLNKNLNYEELAQLYSLADATLMLSRKETFSLVTAESISCGTPVVGFESGGPESIALLNRAKFFKNGDLDGLIAELQNLSLKKDFGTDFYKKEKMCDSYIEICNKLYKNK